MMTSNFSFAPEAGELQMWVGQCMSGNDMVKESLQL